MKRIKSKYIRIPKKLVKNYSIAIAIPDGFRLVHPVKKTVRDWKEYPSSAPKFLIVLGAKKLFKSFPLPSMPDFILCKDELFIHSCKRFKICAVANYLWFSVFQSDQDLIERLREVFSYFIENQVPIRLTLSSTAFLYFIKETSLNGKSLFLHCPDLHKDFSRKKLFTPLSKVEKGIFRDVWKYDVNSAYPYQLAQSMPIAPKYIGTVTEKDIRSYNDVQSVNFVQLKQKPVSIPSWTKKDEYSILTHRATIEELNRGNVQKILKSVIFASSDQQKRFIENMYNQRTKKGPFFSSFIKLMMNSVFGQFAKKIHDIKIIENPNDGMIFHQTYISPNESYEIEQLKDICIIRRLEGKYSPVSCPWVALSIFQNHLLDFVPQISNDCIYIDSDCFVSHNRQKLSISASMGEWKEDFSDLFRVFGVKNYSFNEKLVLAGVKETDTIQDRFTDLDILSNRETGSLKYQFTQTRSVYNGNSSSRNNNRTIESHEEQEKWNQKRTSAAGSRP